MAHVAHEPLVWMDQACLEAAPFSKWPPEPAPRGVVPSDEHSCGKSIRSTPVLDGSFPVDVHHSAHPSTHPSTHPGAAALAGFKGTGTGSFPWRHPHGALILDNIRHLRIISRVWHWLPFVWHWLPPAPPQSCDPHPILFGPPICIYPTESTHSGLYRIAGVWDARSTYLTQTQPQTLIASLASPSGNLCLIATLSHRFVLTSRTL